MESSDQTPPRTDLDGDSRTKETLQQQLEFSQQLDFLRLPYHRAILEDRIPLSIGGDVGQSRTLMLRLRKAHLGEVSVTVWPKEICAKKNIFALEQRRCS
jgi:aspartate--ammonia ligase